MSIHTYKIPQLVNLDSFMVNLDFFMVNFDLQSTLSELNILNMEQLRPLVISINHFHFHNFPSKSIIITSWAFLGSGGLDPVISNNQVPFPSRNLSLHVLFERFELATDTSTVAPKPPFTPLSWRPQGHYYTCCTKEAFFSGSVT